MTRNYYFADIKKYLDNKSAVVPILEACSSFADVAIIFTPIVFGPQFLPLLECLDAKDRLVEAGKKLLTFIETQAAPDYKEKMQQIDSAYIILSLTALVEAFREELPTVDLKEIIKYFKENECFEHPTSEVEANSSERCKSVSLIFPNEVDSVNEVKESLRGFYESTCKDLNEHFKKTIERLEKSANATSREKKLIDRIKNIISKLSKVPERALTLYTAQLVDLMSKFPEFSAYIQLREFASLKANVKQSEMKFKSFDVGLENLADQIRSITKSQKKEEAETIFNDLRKFYKNEIMRPIANNNDAIGDDLTGGITTEKDNKELSFPSIKDAFISQAYRCLRYDGIIGLENPKAWKKIPKRENIGDFFINYLGLPQSVEYPLIVLGLPGSGKSILTKMLAAQLMDSTYTVIRIPLRDIDANNDIHVAISEQITKVIQRPLKDGYAGFAEHFNNDPLFIIFDGYDELLQVKGEVFNGYISKIHEFQKEQYGLGRPVRVMITSRVTLIDKVKIPKNSVILNLDKFDQERRNTWIDIWNSKNKEFFSHNKVKPFNLKDEKDLSENIRELSEQPLLLLMLAIFDSYGNALESLGDNISRTHLYDELLRRICRREANKLYSIKQGDIDAFIERYVQGEMSRLGVVAIGMFNRNLLHIKTKDLLSDLLTFKIPNEWNEIPKEADNLIRSFFFVHKSITDNDNESKKDYAYEFLHNTFGEFLAADFILNYLVREAGELFSAQTNRMQGNIVQKKLYDPNGLGDEWFINLMFNPLYSRPLVIEMIREHLPCVLKRYNFFPQDFQSSLLELVKAQLKMFLEEKNLPSIFRHLDGFKDLKLPLIGHISTYTLNITILAALLLDDGFTFDERSYRGDTSQESETSPWDKLSNLWKTWFSSDNLTGLARIIRSDKTSVDDGKLSCINLTCPSRIDDAESGLNSIEKQLSVANALSDQMSIALFGLQTPRFTDIAKKSVNEIVEVLKSVDQNLHIRYVANLIRLEIYNNHSLNKIRRINELVSSILSIAAFTELNSEVVIEYLSIIEITLSSHLMHLENQRRVLEAIRRTEASQDYSILLNQIINLLSRNIDELLENDLHHFSGRKLSGIYYNVREYSNRIGHLRSTEAHLDNDAFGLAHAFDTYERFSSLSEDNIIEYIWTDPLLVSQNLLSISQQKHISGVTTRKIFDDYKNCIVRNYGGRQLRFSRRVLIYSLQIAVNLRDTQFEKFVRDVLLHDLFNERYIEGYLNIFLLYPGFLVIVIENIREICKTEWFLELLLEMERVTDRYSLYTNSIILLMVQFIKIFRDADLRYLLLKTKVEEKMGRFITGVIIGLLEKNENICDVLTKNDYNDVLWFSTNYNRDLRKKISNYESEEKR